MQNIPLNEIIKLEDLSDEIRSQYVSRPLVAQHVMNLKQVPTDQLPPIKVMKFEKGYAVIDGQHRVARAKELDETQIGAEFVDFLGMNDIIMKAWSANQDHGLPEKVSRRVDFALWLVVSHGMSIREAAKVAKCDFSSVVRRKKKLREQETEEKPVENERLKPLMRLFKAIDGLKNYEAGEEGLFSDIRECLNSTNDAIEDIEENIVSLVESYLLVVNT